MFRPLFLLAAIVAPLSAAPFNAYAVVRDNEALTLQVALDRAGFSPGVIDGTAGRLTREAIKGFQEAKGITVTGNFDPETKAALGDPTSATETVEVTDAGPFLAHIPKSMEEKAKLDKLDYSSVQEAIAERY